MPWTYFGCVKFDPSLCTIDILGSTEVLVCVCQYFFGRGEESCFLPPHIREGEGGLNKGGGGGGFLSKSLRIAAEVEKVGQYCVSRTGPAYFFLCANTQKTGFCNNMTTSIMFIFGTSMCIYLILRRLKRAGSVCLFLCFLNLCQFAWHRWRIS